MCAELPSPRRRVLHQLDPELAEQVLKKRGLVAKKYVLPEPRHEAKGIFELVAGYKASGLPLLASSC